MIVFYAVQVSLLGAALVLFVARSRAIAGMARDAAGSALAASADEAHADLAHVASSGAYVLRGIGRVAPPLALTGAIVVMGRGFGTPTGLAALKAGFAARTAVAQAGVAFGIGMATSLLCFMAAADLVRRARAARAGLDRADRVLDRSGTDV